MALVVQFLTSIRRFVTAQDDVNLRDWLRVESAVPGIYFQLAAELRSSFPKDGDRLERTVDNSLPEEDDVSDDSGSPWPGLNSFVVAYLEYWRDVDFDDPARLYAQLSDLLISCANALAHPTYGVMLLKTSMSLSESLSKLVMNLTRQPHIMAQVRRVTTGEGERKSIVESAADVIQKIFTSCLMDRSSNRWDQPKGKKVGIYIFANLVLKLLFTCKKSRLAVQMFTNIANMGPALSLYPAAQRVTYLYYLGRFYFDCNHFTRAHSCLEEAYRQCPPRFQKHRRLIVTYWIPANLLLGRFPSAALLRRPEAACLGPVFLPLCAAVRAGDFLAFHAALAARRSWLWDRGLYLPLLYRLRPLLWRSFARRVFLLTHATPDRAAGRAAPVLDLADLAAAATYVQRRLEGAAAHAATAVSSGLAAPPGGPRALRASEGLLCGNMEPDADAVEGVLAPLVAAGLINGFVAHSQRKLAILGAKQLGGNALAAGWPNVYRSIVQRLEEEAPGDEGPGGGGDVWGVPAWVKAP